MRAYVFSMMMFLLSLIFISFPMLSAVLLSAMALMIAVFAFLAERQLRKVPVVVEEVHIKSWDSWT